MTWFQQGATILAGTLFVAMVTARHLPVLAGFELGVALAVCMMMFGVIDREAR